MSSASLSPSVKQVNDAVAGNPRVLNGLNKKQDWEDAPPPTEARPVAPGTPKPRMLNR